MGVPRDATAQAMNDLSYWIFRSDNQLLILPGENGSPSLPLGFASDFQPPQDSILVGEWQGKPCYGADVAQFPALPGAEPLSLRALFHLGGMEICSLAGRAIQLLDWQKQHRYCGQCGTPTTRKDSEFAMVCPNCSLAVYPRISPAIMVLVRHAGKLLLGRSPHFKPGVFSVLAGFVEAGETLEDCAIREVKEEVGIEIANLRYFKSQSWPFPNSLMVGFFADYAGGSITPDPQEIEAADWFSPDALPLLPDPISMSRQMIEACCQAQGRDQSVAAL